jgi:PX domain
VALSPSVVSPPPSHTSPPQPASGSTATSSTSTQVIPRIVNQLDVGEALLYHKLELCDVVAKVSSFHVSKSKGAEYVEYAIEVHMLADAYARMCVHNNVPVARHGDVYCYTRYYRYSKFAKFHERLQAANPNVTLPPFPSASLFQFLDTSFLSSRLKKLQT